MLRTLAPRARSLSLVALLLSPLTAQPSKFAGFPMSQPQKDAIFAAALTLAVVSTSANNQSYRDASVVSLGKMVPSATNPGGDYTDDPADEGVIAHTYQDSTDADGTMHFISTDVRNEVGINDTYLDYDTGQFSLPGITGANAPVQAALLAVILYHEYFHCKQDIDITRPADRATLCKGAKFHLEIADKELKLLDDLLILLAGTGQLGQTIAEQEKSLAQLESGKRKIQSRKDKYEKDKNKFC